MPRASSARRGASRRSRAAEWRALPPATCVPLTYTRTVRPSQVIARCDHVFTGSGDGPPGTPTVARPEEPGRRGGQQCSVGAGGDVGHLALVALARAIVPDSEALGPRSRRGAPVLHALRLCTQLMPLSTTTPIIYAHIIYMRVMYPITRGAPSLSPTGGQTESERAWTSKPSRCALVH
jgi:hypothetical protein